MSKAQQKINPMMMLLYKEFMEWREEEQKKELNAEICNWIINANNQITSRSDGSTFSYDDNGNMTNRVHPDSAWDYTWNSENQLVDATASSGASVQFEYDVFGRRISMTSSASTTEFVYNGQDILLEYQDSVLSKRYTKGPAIDEHLVMTDLLADENYYYHTDLLGSTLALSNEAGSIIERYTYSTYGAPTITNADDEIITQSTVGNRFHFTGREYDYLTGLYYHRARYRDAELGIWLSKDPAGFVDGLNLYGFVRGNPIRYTDPSGKNTAIAVLVAIGVVSGFVGGAVTGSSAGGLKGAVKGGLIGGTIGAATAGFISGGLVVGGVANLVGQVLGNITNGQRATNNISGGSLVGSVLGGGLGSLFGGAIGASSSLLLGGVGGFFTGLHSGLFELLGDYWDGDSNFLGDMLENIFDFIDDEILDPLEELFDFFSGNGYCPDDSRDEFEGLDVTIF